MSKLFKDLTYAGKLLLYRQLNKRPFNFDAVFSDETEEYTVNNPPGPGGLVTVKLRLYRGQRCGVALCIEDGAAIGMKRVSSAGHAGYFDFYAASFVVHEKTRYYFRIVTPAGEVFYYNQRGISEYANPDYHFRVIPGYKTPDWAKGAVMYQIFVDRFYNGDKTNDPVNNEYAYIGRATKLMDDWREPVLADDVCNFYGGDLAGIIQKMPYLSDLGVDVLYLSPIFVSPSSHKYDIQDYGHVDPHFGVIENDGGEPLYFERFSNKYATKHIKRVTDKDNLEKSDDLLAELIREAHRRGIKVILDGVFNHCGAFNRWLDTEDFYGGGAFLNKGSPYSGYFRFAEDSWPGNKSYDCWWEHKNHPKLYYENSRELYDYIMDIARKWVSPPYNADGWRLDVAADVGYSPAFNHKFWRDFREAVKTANPNAVIIAEHYGDPADWLSGGEWDTVMNYDAFMEPFTWFFCGMEKHSLEFREDMLSNAMVFENSMRYYTSRLPNESLLCAMNQISNHDHSRFLTRTNRRSGRLHTDGPAAAGQGTDRSVLLAAITAQMTWPGAPCIYYGDEAGLAGWTDPDSRRTYPWGEEDAELIEFHKTLIGLRKKHPCLRRGSTVFMYGSYGVLCYGRMLGDDKAVILINNNQSAVSVPAPVWKINAPSDSRFIKLLETGAGGYDTRVDAFNASSGVLNVRLPAVSSIIMRPGL